jgi:hypothetical protein
MICLAHSVSILPSEPGHIPLLIFLSSKSIKILIASDRKSGSHVMALLQTNIILAYNTGGSNN